MTTPNVTTAVSRAALASESVTEHQVWASLIKPTTPSPATAPKRAQSPAPDDLSTEPLASGVTATDVGLFEGASHHQLGIFRPFADCRMRHTQASFCPVCEHTIRARLGAWELPSEKPISSFVAGQVTHVFTVPLLALAFGTYDTASGAVHLFEGFATTFGSTPKDLIAPGAALPAGCTSVVTFDGPGGPFVYTHSFPPVRARCIASSPPQPASTSNSWSTRARPSTPHGPRSACRSSRVSFMCWVQPLHRRGCAHPA